MASRSRGMAADVHRRGIALVLVAVALATLGAPVAQGDPGLDTSLDYSLEPLPYDNSVLAAYVGDMLYPEIVIDRSPSSPFNGTMYLVGLRDEQCGNPVVVRSLDRGQTWGPPMVDPVCAGGLGLDVVVGEDGTLFAAAWGPKILRSGDGGQSWSLIANLGNDRAPTSLAIDRTTGLLYVAWYPSDILTDGRTDILGGPILVSSSFDEGGTWASPVRVTATLNGSYPQLAVHARSLVVAFVGAQGSSDPFVAAASSRDAGTTWAAPVPLSPRAPCLRWSSPSVAVSPSGVFAISWSSPLDPSTDSASCWADWGNATGTFVSISQDEGRTFGTPIQVGGPPASIAVDYFGNALAFDDDSQLYVTWHSFSADGASIFVAHSNQLTSFDEASFTTRLQVSAGKATGQQNLAVGPDGIAYLTWHAEAFPFEPPSSGIFVRSVSGQASGDVVPENIAVPGGLDVELIDLGSGRARSRLLWNGTKVVAGDLPPGLYDVWIRWNGAEVRAGSMPVRAWGQTAFTVHVSEGPPILEDRFPWIAAAGVLGGLLLFSAVLASLQHTRLTRETVLQRKVRLLMYEYIKDRPGASFSEVRDALALQNGAAAYHLGVLERQGLLHSESRRHRRWYYPNGNVSMWRDLPLSSLQMSLIAEVRRNPGIGVRELARTVDRRVSSVADNVKGLAREGLLRTERVGRRLRCFPEDGQTMGPHEGGESDGPES